MEHVVPVTLALSPDGERGLDWYWFSISYSPWTSTVSTIRPSRSTTRTA